jgi:hypothetical protein
MWNDLTRDQKLDALLEVLEVSDDGVVRIKPKNTDGQPHQRMAIGRTGVSISDDDPDPHWYASANLYVGGRVGIQAATGFDQSPTQARKDLSFAARRWQEGQPSSLLVENNNIADQIVTAFWQADHADDALPSYVLFVTAGDASRPHSRNTAVRVDAMNDQGQLGAKATGLEVNLFGADPTNRGIDVSGSSLPANAGIYGTVPIVLTDTQYVTSLYQTLLLREPDAPGLTAWVNALAHGMTREQVKAGFLSSPEYKAKHP